MESKYRKILIVSFFFILIYNFETMGRCLIQIDRGSASKTQWIEPFKSAGDGKLSSQDPAFCNSSQGSGQESNGEMFRQEHRKQQAHIQTKQNPHLRLFTKGG